MLNVKAIFIAILFFAKSVTAQLSIDTSKSADNLVRTILVDKSAGFVIENVTFKGDKKSIGNFRCQMKYCDMFSRGIVLSTGDVFDVKGPNTSPNTSSKTFINDDSDLSSIANGKTFDAAILEFDFIPKNDSVCFRFFFASEEYPEYVKKNVNDVFGFFLTCDELNTKENLALIDDSIPITVDNINAKTNAKYFVENLNWDSENTQGWINNKSKGELAFTFQFDGLTALLNTGAKVTANKKYHIKIAIADVGDRLFDSAIFLEGGSFKSVPAVANFASIIKDEFAEITFKNVDNGISMNLNVNFDADSAKVSGDESLELLDRIFKILNNDKTVSVEIIGHTDNSGKKEYNKVLSLNRAKNVADYLKSKGLESDRIKYEGVGDSRPISETDKSLNRRVEFIFVKKDL